MRGLLAAVIGMGVLIVAGVAVLAILLVQRMSSVAVPIASAPGPGGSAAMLTAVLDEPEGTRIAGVALGPDRAAVQLQGGGPDRAVIVDLRGFRVIGRVGLAR